MFNNNSPFSNKINNITTDNMQNHDDFFNQSTQSSPLADPYPIAPANQTPQSVSPTQPAAINAARTEEQQWFSDEHDTYDGQLALDVYQDKKNIYVKAAIAGVKPQDIEIYLNNDMLTIKGQRHIREEITEEDYYIKECYWGGFSRSIILPVDVKNDQVKASIENGLLTIALPKSKRPKNTRIEVKEIKS